MSLTIFTLVHVAISLVAIGSGFAVAAAMLSRKQWSCCVKLFLVTTFLTSATGFLFPFHGFKPSYVVGIISLIVLAVCVYALSSRKLAGHWRPIYVITAMLALYLNVFVLIVQSFMKLPALHALAPTQTERPFAIAQLSVLVLFMVLTIIAAMRFRIPPESSTS